MSTYLDRLDAHLGNIHQAAIEERDPYRSKLFWNYLHHGAFELSGEWDRIFTSELTVAEPHYEMLTGPGGLMVLDSAEEVKEFYAMIEGENMFLIDDGNHQLFANDNGIAEFATTVGFASGRELQEEETDNWFYNEVDIGDPDAMYEKKSKHAMFWPFTPDAQLIGEMVYSITPIEITQIDAEKVPSLDEVSAVAEQYFPENVSGSTPFPSV